MQEGMSWTKTPRAAGQTCTSPSLACCRMPSQCVPYCMPSTSTCRQAFSLLRVTSILAVYFPPNPSPASPTPHFYPPNPTPCACCCLLCLAVVKFILTLWVTVEARCTHRARSAEVGSARLPKRCTPSAPWCSWAGISAPATRRRPGPPPPLSPLQDF